jgi:single-strand DNA-binding protein
MHLAGHLGADPEVRFTSNGTKVTTLRLATRTRKSGADDTIWYRITVWGEQFDKMISFFKKGSAIIVMGELEKPEIFTDKNGKSQISLNVRANNLMFPPFGRGDKNTNENQNQSSNANQTSNNQDDFATISNGNNNQQNNHSSNFDDEIPF